MKPGEMMKLLAELQLYREREPLVQALLSAVRLSAGYLEEHCHHALSSVQDAAEPVQAFEVKP